MFRLTGESTQWMGNSLIEYVASNGERQLLDISDRINVITENSTAKDELEVSLFSLAMLLKCIYFTNRGNLKTAMKPMKPFKL